MDELQDSVLMAKWKEMLETVERDDLKVILAELRFNWLTRNAILRDLVSNTMQGATITDYVEMRVYCLRLRDMSLAELKEESIIRYQQWLDDTYTFEEAVENIEQERR